MSDKTSTDSDGDMTPEQEVILAEQKRQREVALLYEGILFERVVDKENKT